MSNFLSRPSSKLFLIGTIVLVMMMLVLGYFSAEEPNHDEWSTGENQLGVDDHKVPLLSQTYQENTSTAETKNNEQGVLELASAETNGSISWKAYSKLLKDHVRFKNKFGIEAMLVDYAALKKSAVFTDMTNMLAAPRKFSSNAQKMAFYINAYNFLTIKLIVEHLSQGDAALESIRDLGSIISPVWKKTVGVVRGEQVTLDQIEHDILRPMGDARVHFAVVCASMSCPDIRAEAYTADTLDRQLDEQSAGFIKNATKGLVIEDDELYVSKIFEWYEEDFDPDGGVLAFIEKYRVGTVSFEYYETLDYDWRVNAL